MILQFRSDKSMRVYSVGDYQLPCVHEGKMCIISKIVDGKEICDNRQQADSTPV